MKTCLLLAVLACALIAVGYCAQKATLSARNERAADAIVVPEFRFKSGDKIILRVCVHNTSKKTIRYMSSLPEAQQAAGVELLELVLYNEGRRIPRRIGHYPLPLSKERVRDLPPGHRVSHELSVATWYGDLAAGTYDLVAEYNIPARSTLDEDYGLTPMSFRRNVACLEIEK